MKKRSFKAETTRASGGGEGDLMGMREDARPRKQLVK